MRFVPAHFSKPSPLRTVLGFGIAIVLLYLVAPSLLSQFRLELLRVHVPAGHHGGQCHQLCSVWIVVPAPATAGLFAACIMLPQDALRELVGCHGRCS